MRIFRLLLLTPKQQELFEDTALSLLQVNEKIQKYIDLNGETVPWDLLHLIVVLDRRMSELSEYVDEPTTVV